MDTKPLEFRRIEVLARVFRPDPACPVGIGDDAAVLPGDHHAQVWTVDAAVEHVHFERAWLSAADIGYRAFMAAASDVAAMGAYASQALCAWTLPSDFAESDLLALAQGVERASRLCACPVVGGNLSRGAQLSLTTSVLGRLPGPAVLRSGGEPGHGLYVTGPLGAARIGLERLRRADFTPGDPFVRAFCAPRARLDVHDALRRTASCAIDLSDGLLADLSHLCAASQVGARLDLDALPRLEEHAQACKALGVDAAEYLLQGGEEYELLFASEHAPGAWAQRIGSLRPVSEGIQVVRSDGSVQPLPEGFVHFPCAK